MSPTNDNHKMASLDDDDDDLGFLDNLALELRVRKEAFQLEYREETSRWILKYENDVRYVKHQAVQPP
nr:hypothetical protein [Tanacetum cinerariifolium]